MKWTFLLFCLSLCWFSCENSHSQHPPPGTQIENDSTLAEASPPEFALHTPDSTGTSIDESHWESADPVWVPAETFDREEIKARLAEKVAQGDTLFVHLMVPLCDNENQGIVPVPARIGNGQDPKSNLYWGAGYGIRHFFDKKVSTWQLIGSSTLPENPDILDRVVFFRKMETGTPVCVVADAYDGAKMGTCLEDFFLSLAGRKQNTWTLPNDSLAQIPLQGNADLLIFNGHNGLMDDYADLVANTDGRKKDAMVIACVSYPYFEDYLKTAGGYPLLTTTNLLAPEAYVVEAAISEWARLKDGPAIHHAAGVAYDKYHKCGLRAAKNTFRTGWE